jgi:hypothetical protein
MEVKIGKYSIPTSRFDFEGRVSNIKGNYLEMMGLFDVKD